jgi:hypothetical protein
LHFVRAVARGRIASLATAVANASRHRGLVVAVDVNAPAERPGIAPGDVIVRFGEKQVSHPQDVRAVVIGADAAMHVPSSYRELGHAPLSMSSCPCDSGRSSRPDECVGTTATKPRRFADIARRLSS